VSDWFVANVRELRWQENELGATCEFDKHRERFGEFGINLTVLRPGQPMTMYHREGYQEGFLVLRGECLLLVDDQEIPLTQWDYVHCSRDVPHAIVGAGEGTTSLVLAVGNRVGQDVILYPRAETALKPRRRRRERHAQPEGGVRPRDAPGPRHCVPRRVPHGLAVPGRGG
jgi:uncharacterized cupin superfamily protein